MWQSYRDERLRGQGMQVQWSTLWHVVKNKSIQRKNICKLCQSSSSDFLPVLQSPCCHVIQKNNAFLHCSLKSRQSPCCLFMLATKAFMHCLSEASIQLCRRSNCSWRSKARSIRKTKLSASRSTCFTWKVDGVFGCYGTWHGPYVWTDRQNPVDSL